jgi:hypothetical protein
MKPSQVLVRKCMKVCHCCRFISPFIKLPSYPMAPAHMKREQIVRLSRSR